jgi:hypothetical protein
MGRSKGNKTRIWVKGLFWVAGGLLLLEILLRIFLYLSLNTYFGKNIRSPYREKMRQVLVGPTPYQYDPICYYLPKKGLFRGTDGFVSAPKEKDSKEIRIICAGDSTTYGLAVSHDKSWPYLLEQRLKARFPHQDIRVLNAGYPGASKRQVKRIFQFHLVNYHPDIVLFRKELFGLTDRYAVPKGSNHFRYWLWRGVYESRIFRVLCILTDKWFKDYAMAYQVHDFIMYKFSSHEIEPDTGLKTDFSMIRRIASEHHIPYVAVLDYLRLTKDGDIISDCSTYADRGLGPVICTLEAFNKTLRTRSANEVFIDPEHLTEVGTSIIAEQVFRFLLKERWVEGTSGGAEPSSPVGGRRSDIRPTRPFAMAGTPGR